MIRNNDFIVLPLDAEAGTWVLNATAKVVQEKTNATPLALAANITQTSSTFEGLVLMNNTGKQLWDLLSTEQTSDELIARVVEIYRDDVTTDGQTVSSEVIGPGIIAFLENLNKAHALLNYT